MPCRCARAIARSIARAAIAMPGPACASVTTSAPESLTTSSAALALIDRARIRST
jgi:hypothetical protein